MDRLKTMQAFAEVARQRSFTAAARELGHSTSVISRAVIDLETWLGVDLLVRSTRQVRLTDDGKRILGLCNTLVSQVEQLKADAHDINREPAGELRVTAPVLPGKLILAPLLPAFATRYPKITTSLYLMDRVANLVEEGFDVALQPASYGRRADTSVRTIELIDLRLQVVASPKYLAKMGVPQSARDLKNHNCLVNLQATFKDRWPVAERPGGTTTVSGNISVNSAELILDLVLKGVGIAILPDFSVADLIGKGKLVSLLENHQDRRGGIHRGRLHLVHPNNGRVSPALEAFIDHLLEHFQTETGH